MGRRSRQRLRRGPQWRWGEQLSQETSCSLQEQRQPQGKFRLARISGATSHLWQGQLQRCIALQHCLTHCTRLLPAANCCVPQLSLDLFAHAAQLPPHPRSQRGPPLLSQPMRTMLSPDPQQDVEDNPFPAHCPSLAAGTHHGNPAGRCSWLGNSGWAKKSR